MGSRYRIPVAPEYISALGLATYAFARLEWNVVWCCERLSEGIIHEFPDKTAGHIAQRFVDLVEKMPSGALAQNCAKEAQEFRSLVKVRNDLVHAKPATGQDGEQMLNRDGEWWTVQKIEAAADAFADCSLRLNALLHGPLKAR